MNAGLAPLRSFVLPGGTPLAAHLHLARTVCRRAERLTVALAGLEPVNPEAVRYLNRLSDWLFVAARVANDGGARRRALGARAEPLSPPATLTIVSEPHSPNREFALNCPDGVWCAGARRGRRRCSRASACR